MLCLLEPAKRYLKICRILFLSQNFAKKIIIKIITFFVVVDHSNQDEIEIRASRQTFPDKKDNWVGCYCHYSLLLTPLPILSHLPPTVSCSGQILAVGLLSDWLPPLPPRSELRVPDLTSAGVLPEHNHDARILKVQGIAVQTHADPPPPSF